MEFEKPLIVFNGSMSNEETEAHGVKGWPSIDS